MPASLADLHNAVLQKLRDPDCPRYAVVRSPTGSGIRRVLEILIRDVAASQLVLVLTTRSVVAEQWRDRLTDDDNETRVTVLETSEAVLGLLDDPVAESGGGRVLVATTGKAISGLSGRALSELDYGLVILDEEHTRGMALMERLRADRCIALTSSPDQLAREWPIVAVISLPDVVAAIGRPLFDTVWHAPSEIESLLQQDADQIFRDYAEVSAAWDARRAGKSLASLHTALLDVAAALEHDAELRGAQTRPVLELILRRVWNLLDRVEDASDEDSRLRSLDDVLAAEQVDGNRCVVMAVKVADVSYIAAHLANVGRQVVGAVTSSTERLERETAFRSLNPGQVLVAGVGLAAHLANVPVPYTVILWSSAGLTQVIDRVGATDGVRIRVLAEEGPQGGADSEPDLGEAD